MLVPGEGDQVLATFVGGASRLERPASVWTSDGRVIFNGLNLSEQLNSDTDGDGRPDVIELVQNQLRLLLAR